MRVDLYLHISPDGEDAVITQLKLQQDQLTQISNFVQTLITGETKMSQQLDDLTSEVTNATTVEAGAVTLIQNIAASLAAAGTDPVKLQALKDTLANSDAALAAAIVTNTPAAPVS